ncbi:DUF927 domain-containing protein [Clostridium sp.]|uniref:DUF927 domain-containing protein n=1 Tax=Clostridium sp. TaxID=1506 RepID=UPI003D6CE8FD
MSKTNDLKPLNSEIVDIEKVLSILNPENEVLELRILKTTKGTVSGYFNSMEKLAQTTKCYEGKNNIYITLNPCNHELLARCINKVKQYTKEATKDNEIRKRLWLPIDFDPVRPSGISSSDEEHQTALQRAIEVKDFLLKKGFPDGILADSGNGAHLLYKIDMENTDENKESIKKFLLALDYLYSDEKVDIDKCVYNSARIWKLYGTKAVKGDNLPERPHRISKILDLPNELNAVDVEKIKEIICMLPSINKKESSSFATSESNFSVEDFIKKYEIEAYSKKPYNGGELWRIKCPMNEEHTDKSAYIIQFSNGAISAGCHHNSCEGWGWKDLRIKFEPNCYEKKSKKHTANSIDIELPPPHLAEYHEKLSPRFGIDENGMLYKSEYKNDELVKNVLSNFIAIPVETTLVDDGFGKTQSLKIKGYIGNDELPTLTINSSEFSSMNWINTWGLKPNIFAGYGGRDKVRDATQCLADYGKNINEFNHLGWKKINNKWCYLHANGAIGADNIKVNMKKDGLQSYSLENPNDFTQEDLQESVKKSLALLDVHKDAFILWGLCYLTPLCEPLRQAEYEPGFSVWVEGRSGSQKTTFASLFLNHFGKGFSVTNLPASFKDTSNAMERKSAICKDSLLIIDDFKPATSKREKDEMIKKARDILWSYSNRSGRQRMKADTSLRQAYTAKGMAIFTGEDNPSIGGESTVVRYLSMELKRGEIDLTKLTDCQKHALFLNKSMSGYIKWLLEKMDSLPNELKQLFEKFRDESINIMEGHNRFHGIMAWMQLGLTYGLQFAVEIDSITEDKKTEIIENSMKRLLEIIKKQSQQAEEEKISEKFLSTMSELINSGKVKIKSLLDDEFEEEEKGIYTGQSIGWCDDEFYYLLPQVTYSSLTQFFSKQGLDFGIMQNTLYKELAIDRISTVSKSDNRSTVVKKIKGKPIRVLKIYKALFEEK